MSMLSDSALCSAIVRRHARTFSLASVFLPRAKRRAANALYAFCRVVDDAVDDATATDGRAAIVAHQRALAAALDGAPSGPVMRELAWAARTYDVPPRVLFELVAGIARDTEGVAYPTWPALAQYCEGVASTVGEMCTHVFGVADPGDHARAIRYARTLGLAMQLTNILRDVGEDAARGRCYLPDEDLALFDLTRERVLRDRELAHDERWAPFMAFEIGRARMLYEAAMPGIALLAPDAQRCAAACARGYSRILGAIEAIRYDTVNRRARVGNVERVRILAGTLTGADVPRRRHEALDPAPISAMPFSALQP